MIQSIIIDTLNSDTFPIFVKVLSQTSMKDGIEAVMVDEQDYRHKYVKKILDAYQFKAVVQ
jgi:hypothetical protein